MVADFYHFQVAAVMVLIRIFRRDNADMTAKRGVIGLWKDRDGVLEAAGC